MIEAANKHSQPWRRAPHILSVNATLLLIAFAATGLGACGTGVDPRAQALAHEAKIYHQEHAELVALVSCAHQHGIDLPPPTTTNKVSTQGVNLKSPGRKAALSACYHKVVVRAAQQQQVEGGGQQGRSAGSSQGQQQPQSPATSAREHTQLIELVACARRHGIHLPEPDAQNHVNTRGVNLKGRRREAIMKVCFHKVVTHATREQEAAGREREQSSNGFGE